MFLSPQEAARFLEILKERSRQVHDEVLLALFCSCIYDWFWQSSNDGQLLETLDFAIQHILQILPKQTKIRYILQLLMKKPKGF